MTTDSRLQSLSDKLQLLLKDYGRLQKENQRLAEAVHLARQQNMAQQTEIDELKQQVQVLKLAAGSLGEKEKKEFEKRLNQYIRDVEKCIAVLSE